MGGNFRSGRAGGCGNPQAQIDFVLLAGTGLRGNAKPFFCAKCAFAESPNSYIFKRSRRVCVHKKKRSAKAQKASRKSTDGLLFLLSVFAARTGFLSASQWAQKTGACFAHAPVLRQAVRLEEFFIERLGRLFRIVVAAEFCELLKLCTLGVG